MKTRELIIKTVKLFVNKSKVFSIVDNGESEMIFINPKSVTIHFKEIYTDFDGETEDIFFSLEFMVWNEIRYSDSDLIDNPIRGLVEHLHGSIQIELDKKKAIDKANQAEERAKKLSFKALDKMFNSNPFGSIQVWEAI